MFDTLGLLYYICVYVRQLLNFTPILPQIPRHTLNLSSNSSPVLLHYWMDRNETLDIWKIQTYECYSRSGFSASCTPHTLILSCDPSQTCTRLWYELLSYLTDSLLATRSKLCSFLMCCNRSWLGYHEPIAIFRVCFDYCHEGGIHSLIVFFLLFIFVHHDGVIFLQKYSVDQTMYSIPEGKFLYKKFMWVGIEQTKLT